MVSGHDVTLFHVELLKAFLKYLQCAESAGGAVPGTLLEGGL